MTYRFVFDAAIGVTSTDSTFVGEPVDTIKEAEAQLAAIAGYTLFLHECGLMYDHSNYGFIERSVDGVAWECLEDEDKCDE